MLDQDDVWPPTALRHHIEARQQHPNADATWGSQQLFLEPGASCPSWLRPHFLEHPTRGTFFSGFLARREVFERVGPLDESYLMGSDTDWFARAQEAQLNTIHLPEVTLLKRVHSENHSAQVETAHLDLTRALHASLQRRRAQTPNSR
ncbi:hypothetical protein EON80_27670 [bacterium]|nr:MAG: hypothetical protein EON80_27670 [bacterium]